MFLSLLVIYTYYPSTLFPFSWLFWLSGFFPYLHIHYLISLSISAKKLAGILIGIVLNQQTRENCYLKNIVTFNPQTWKTCSGLLLFLSFVGFVCSFVQFLAHRSYENVIKFIPKNFMSFTVIVNRTVFKLSFSNFWS